MRNASKMARYMMMRTGRENGDTRNEGRRGDYTRSEYGGNTRAEYDGGMRNNYGTYNGGYEIEIEDRFRDRRGREHYDNGRYAPQSAYNEGGGMQDMRAEGGMESRRGQRRGRDGRFRAEGGGGMRSHYDDDDEEYRMNTIGFGNRDMPEPIWQTGGARIDNGSTHEMERRSGTKEHGGAYAEDMKLTPELAKEWTSRMKNGDGTTGAHWTMEQTKQLMQQRGINVAPVEFFAVLNSVYSDYCNVAKKHNVHNIDFYIDITKAWLDDKDAVPDKAAAYYECVVKH